MLAPGLVKD